MQVEFTCEQCRTLMPDFVGDGIDALQRQQLDQHLEQCEQCNASLQQLWELQAMSSRWHDETVPGWSRRQTFFESFYWWPGLQVFTTFTSMFVMVLVLSQAQISIDNGLSIRFGDVHDSRLDETSFLTEANLEHRVAVLRAQLEQQQQDQLRTNASRLTDQQVATSQLLLKTVLDMSRAERRQELGSLLTAWDINQDRRAKQTSETLHLLLINQIEDRQDIEQLNRFFSEAALEGNSL